MWAAFAERAERELHRFHGRRDFDDLAAGLSAHVVDSAGIVAVLPSTVDPAFLSLCLAVGGRAELVALMFEHVIQPAESGRVDIRLATVADQRPPGAGCRV